MRAQRMFMLGLVLATGGAMCLAQSSMGAPGQGMGQQGMGRENQPGMGQPGGMAGNTPESMSNDTMQSPDHMFVVKAAQGGMAEVKLGELAKQNGGTDAVKQFGERMVTDHSHANDELRQLAQQQGIALPANMSRKDRQTDKMLESKQGAEFDKAYIRDMVKDHEKDVAEFRREAENGKDPAVKAWAQKTLPVLEQHLGAAQHIAAQEGVASGKASPGAMSSNQ